ncbi:SRPBCC family protein [Nonomuraea jiangxiensis]|uniref:Carbon monoxide dehydrogenase subunit G n=1 Tax=Nonomuraea jiangxiensis TaxID=633440 RepID=A0A1G8FYY5_9ACTN|nr:SRPBCC family protein [Nonomuraea jiangxiensis]SDH87333.1 Carbon monoxide dehydrogenase subunit G [Nonomuraea jiangxiensis]
MAMRFEHEFTVPVPIEQAWAVLLDVERVAPCLPGATLDLFEDDEFTGRMKVKVGPITVTYRGSARFEDVDKDSSSLTIKASGKEARGSGTASATVKARMVPRGEATAVTVETSFNVTGRPAQFGRGVMAEVGGKLIEKFAANLAALLTESTVEPAPAAAPAAPQKDAGRATAQDERHLSAVPAPPAQEARPVGTLRTSRTADEEALDLLEIAGQPLLKRLAPVAGALAALLVIVWVIRRLIR